MSQPELDRQHIISELKGNCATPHRISLKFGACIIAVNVSHHEMVVQLERYFKPFVCTADSSDIIVDAIETSPLHLPVTYTTKQPDPGKTKIKEAFVDLKNGRIVRKCLTDMVFVFGQGDNLAVGPCLKNLNQVINFINNRYIEWVLCHGGLLGHAAGVVVANKGIALAGFSGAGKSTLALRLMNEGGTFISNDRLMIRKKNNRLQMLGVAKLPRINPGTILNNPALQTIMNKKDRERFLALDKKALWDIEYKYDAPIEACYGENRFMLETTMDHLVLLNWQQTNEPVRIQPVNLEQRRDLLPAFMKSVGLFFLSDNTSRMPSPSEQNYIDYLALCDVWEVSGGVNFDAATQRLLTLLTERSSVNA